MADPVAVFPEVTRPCPDCANSKEGPSVQKLLAENEVEGYGVLQQCGKTHLKTKTWRCWKCGRIDWDPAPDAPWHTTTVREPLTGKVLSVPRQIPVDACPSV